MQFAQDTIPQPSDILFSQPYSRLLSGVGKDVTEQGYVYIIVRLWAEQLADSF